MKDNSSSSGGISFFGLLGIVFITLKLIGTIDWPWIWVLSPLWIPIALVIFILLIQMTIVTINTLIEKNEEEDEDEKV